MSSTKYKLITLFVIAISVLSTYYWQYTYNSKENPILVNEDLSFYSEGCIEDFSHNFNVECGEEFNLGHIEKNSILNIKVNFTYSNGYKYNGMRIKVLSHNSSLSIIDKSFNVPRPEDIPKEIGFEQNIGITKNYILQIWPSSTTQNWFNFSIAVTLQPPSFLLKYWWIIGSYFAILALAPVFINRYRMNKWREYRMLNTNKLEI